MNDENETKILSVIHALLQEAGITNSISPKLVITKLAGDGSSRKFWRIMEGDRNICLAVAPPRQDTLDLAEAKAARSIGLHLLQQGVRVPDQYGWDEQYGVLLFEDLGDEKLHEYVVEKRKADDWIGQVRASYTAVVKKLALMQIRGAEGFDPEWCWDSPRYDKKLMLERESEYFLRAFWQGYLGNEEPSGLGEEFLELADRSSHIPASYFLHRDFQSRNIMLYRDEPCFIDFQGGRLGPLAYDLASLLIDPYVGLPLDFQEELLELYLDQLEMVIDVDRRKFVEEYLLLALQRNLQIVGAFSFLTKQRGKVFFAQYIGPATASLNTLLGGELFSEMVVLRQTVSSAVKSFAGNK
ncbi:aminoglycoside phosphotransferase family protein [Desulfocapsa sulfexigens]|nr:phosphotransferase [Desulfocapsa sulfexigens]